jgi:cytochrome c oxidase assembly protein Cox11
MLQDVSHAQVTIALLSVAVTFVIIMYADVALYAIISLADAIFIVPQ